MQEPRADLSKGNIEEGEGVGGKYKTNAVTPQFPVLLANQLLCL